MRFLISAGTLVTICLLTFMVPLGNRPADKSFPKFVEQTIDGNLGIGYAVVLTDVNGDNKTDVVAINQTQLIWYNNPEWKKHVLMDGLTQKDNVCVAPFDIDGDGRMDFALGAAWMPTNTQTGGSLQWLRQPNQPGKSWELFPVGSEPTLHRIRWADCDGDGTKELIVAPLQGRETKAPKWEEGKGVRLLRYGVPKDPVREPWTVEVIDDSLHVLHNFLVVNFDDDRADEILTASFEGIYLLNREADGKWTKRMLGEGNQEEESSPGAGEVKLGRFKSGKRFLATIEPWHGHQLVVYVETAEAGALWERRVLDAKLKQGHALACANMDDDADDEIVVGWREQSETTRAGVAVYDSLDEAWTGGRKSVVDDGGISTEDLAVSDLNGDGFNDIVASGRATHNLKIYWHPANSK